MSKPKLQAIPLGGLGEFGMNMMALRYGEDMIVIDAGMMFPEAELLGVDIVIPDISYLLEHRQQVRALILTHGHEDHIGAVPYFLADLNVPVYGTPFTLALVEEKLEEHALLDTAKLHKVRPKDKITVGPFEIEFIHVTHSIVNSTMLAITTPLGVILHTGDFKVDPTPIDNEQFDLHAVADYGKRGVLALFSDSTNVERPGYTQSERAVIDPLDGIFSRAGQRIFASCFASSIHRIQILVDLSARYDRRVAFVGRSVIRNTEIAHRLDYLEVPDGLLMRPNDIKSGPRDRTTVIISGCQGEPLSALARAAVDDHRHAVIQTGDTVILSSRIIPGNEKGIFRMINHLFKRGAHVVYESGGPLVHVSGHGSQEELTLMLNLVRPRYFIPIHGEYRQLCLHGRMASHLKEVKEVFLLESGDVLEFDAEGARKAGRVNVGRVCIDSGTVDEVVEDMVIRDRKHISEDGIVLPIIAINRQTGKVESQPEIVTRGFVFAGGEDGILTQAKEIILGTLEHSSGEERADWGLIKEKIRADLKRFIKKQTDRHPLIFPVILEI
ncbi:MAG: ribonuclease J [Acidobacteria bacterium RIFCSPLOWO2_02_FULL_61_28]|nr:MAG: ribonuclease J [Acidobacteria bacterium RIFCSPLOWO2_02_FULL_61_28]